MSKKRYLAAFGAAGVVFAGVYGAAASLTVEGGTIQAGQDDSLACSDKATVESYLYEFEAAEGQNISRGVRVRGLGNCAGEELIAAVYNGDQRLALKAVPIDEGTERVEWNQPVSAKDITRVRLAID